MLLGFTGLKRCGKDTATAYVLSKFKKSSQLMLADPMKRGLMVMFGFTWEQVNGINYDREQIEPDYGVSIRHMLQTLGTEWGRNMLNENVWLNRQAALMAEDPHTIYVMSDVRFENEANFCRKHGTLIHIIADKDHLGDEDSHESEAGLLPMQGDRHIENRFDGLENYHADIDKVLIEIFTERGEA